MKSIFKIMFGFCLLFFCISASKCRKEEIVSSPSIVDESTSRPLELKWKEYLYDAAGAYSINPILNANKDILMSACFNSVGDPEIMKLYDGRTGHVKWQWKDYLRHEEYFLNECHAVSEDILILSAYNATYAMNMLSGQTVWKHMMDTMYGSHMVYVHNGYVYKGFQGESGRYQCYIFRTPVNFLNWELVCTYTDSTKQFDRMNVGSISFTESKKGDDLMICPLTCGGTGPSFAHIYCYNLTKRKYEWIKSFPEKYYGFLYEGAKIVDRKIILYAVRSIYFYILSLNLEDGSFVWDRELVSDGVGLFVYNKKIVSTVNGRSPVICYDPGSGNIIWKQNFSPEVLSKLNFASGDAIVFKNYLFSTQCDNLLVLNLDNGSIVFNKKVSVDGGCLQYGVAINEADRTFYVQDRKYVCCYKLPFEVKY